MQEIPVDRSVLDAAVWRLKGWIDGEYSYYTRKIAEDLKISPKDAAAVEELMRTCVLNKGDYEATLDGVYHDEFARAEKQALALLPVMRREGLVD